MPEHVHLLIYPLDDGYGISSILKSIKQPVANRAIAYIRRNVPDFLRQMCDEQPNGKIVHRFWQRGGGYDRNLWSPSYLWETIDYIHDNPVRRGLCDSPTDWIWSSASNYLGESRGPLAIQMEELPNDPRDLNRRGYT